MSNGVWGWSETKKSAENSFGALLFLNVHFYDVFNSGNMIIWGCILFRQDKIKNWFD